MMILIFFVLIWSFDQNSAFTCSDTVCQNGGTCIQIGKDLAYCVCINGYTGEKCNDAPQVTTTAPTTTTSINICFDELCRNGGSCMQLSGNKAYCQCTPGYFGTFCENKESTTGSITETTTETTTGTTTKSSQLKMCPNNTICQNNGTCLYTDAGTIVCNCPLPYNGTFCQFGNKFCDLNPCKNGAACEQTEGFDGKCICALGYQGRTCDTKPCDADKNPCKNALTCLQIDDKFQCLCQGGFTGDYCEIPL